MTIPAVRFLPEAVEDLLETKRWYGRREPALAGDFADAFAAAMERIRRDLRSFPLNSRADSPTRAVAVPLCRVFP
jgi:hypothetical protein